MALSCQIPLFHLNPYSHSLTLHFSTPSTSVLPHLHPFTLSYPSTVDPLSECLKKNFFQLLFGLAELLRCNRNTADQKTKTSTLHDSLFHQSYIRNCCTDKLTAAVSRVIVHTWYHKIWPIPVTLCSWHITISKILVRKQMAITISQRQYHGLHPTFHLKV